MDASRIMFYTILMLFGIGLFVALQSYVIGLDMSAWSFEGAAIAKLIVPILPVLFLLGVVLVPVYFIMEGAN